MSRLDGGLRNRRMSTLCAVLLMASPAVCQGQAFVESVWPPVVQRGTVNRLTLSGREVEQVLGLWTSVPGTAIEAVAPDEGDGTTVHVDVRVPAHAPLGLYGLRLATRSGLSNAHLFLIDELPVTERSGPDDEPLPVSLPASVAAPCRRGAVDRYAIDVPAGRRLTFEVIGSRFGKDYDPVVTLRDAQGRLLAQHDNDVGLFFDCRFEHTFATAGRYLVEVSDSRYEGDPGWHYVLRMGDFPVARTAVPSSVVPGQGTTVRLPQMPGASVGVSLPADHPRGRFFYELRTSADAPATWIPLWADDIPIAPAEASPISLPAVVHGVLDRPGAEGRFEFDLTKGETVVAQSEARLLGSAADLELVLYEPANEPNGREVLRVDETTRRDPETNTTYATEAGFRFTARADGRHVLVVRELTGAGGPAYTYRVDLRGEGPKLELAADVARLTVPQGSWQPVPLRVTRTGFQGAVELSLKGAPAGVRLEPSHVPADAGEFVGRLIAGPSAAEGLATIQIVGRAEQDGIPLEAIAATHPLIDRQLVNKDRIRYALRENQRDLPPSLTGRIALMVAPPAPFEWELPDATVVLPKYQSAGVRLITQRAAGFDAPIRFTATGGQIGPEDEERVQIFGRFPEATPDRPDATGILYTRILTRFETHRVDVSATAVHQGYRVTLTRHFALDVRSAFAPAFGSDSVELAPGETVRVKVLANRVATFDGPVTLTVPVPLPGFEYPERIEFAAGQEELEFELKAGPDTAPRRYQLRFESTGDVGRYQEFLRSPLLQIDVKK